MEKGTRKRKKKQGVTSKIPAVNIHTSMDTIDRSVWAVVIAVIVFYAIGWWNTAPQFAVICIALTVASETLKPNIGRLAEEAFVAGYTARGTVLIVAGVACIAWGVTSGVVAVHSMGEPARVYAQAQGKVSAAEAKLTALQAKLTSLPQPTEKMPAVRITAMEASNAAVRDALKEPIAVASAGVAEAKEAAAKVKRAGPAMEPPWEAAVGVPLLIELLIFGVPWGRSKRAVRPTYEAKEPEPDELPNKRVARPEPTPPQKVNTGGWATRREKYGQSGRRRKGKPKLAVVA